MQSGDSPVVAVGHEQPPLLHTCAHTPTYHFHAFISEPEKYVRKKYHPFIIAYSKHKLSPTKYTLVLQDLTHNSTGFYKGHIPVVLFMKNDGCVTRPVSPVGFGPLTVLFSIFCKVNYLMGVCFQDSARGICSGPR